MPLERSLGYMLQGVSQQPRQIRRDGQVSEQINRVPDVVLGNTSRAGADRIGYISDEITGRSVQFIERNGVTYILAYKTDAVNPIRIFELDGTEMTVNYNSDTEGYFSDDMSFYVYDGTIYCTNRSKVVQMDPSVVTDALRQNEAIVRLFGANLGQRYTIVVRDSSGAYTAKTKVAEDDVDTTNAELIAQQLVTGDAEDSFSGTTTLNSVLPAYYAVSRSRDHIRIVNTNGDPFDIQVNDNGAGDTITAISKEIKDVDDLPLYAGHLMYVKVLGDATTDDDYYMRFEVTDYDGSGPDFGQSGAWVECAVAGEDHYFDAETMPHFIDLEAGEWTVSQGDFDERKVGDEDSNPLPDFVGRAITDIKEFQSRLAFSAGAYVCLSVTDKPKQFFKNSATQGVDTDPISVRSAKAASIAIQWLVPFDRDLIAVSADAQLLLSGSTKLTPDNASLVLSTGYNMSERAAPATTGQTLLLPFVSGSYSGVQEFFTKSTAAVNSADGITATLSRYIEGEVIEMVSSPSDGIAALRTDHDAQTIYFYKYIIEGDEKTQSAWGKWKFDGDIRAMRFDDGYFYLVLSYDTYAVVLRQSPNRPVDLVGFHVTLDDKQLITVDNYTVDLPAHNVVFVGASGVTDPGEIITPLEITDLGGNMWRYEFPPWSLSVSAQLYCGHRIYRELRPTMPVYKDYQGKPVVNANITVSMFLLNYVNSGEMRAQMVCKWRSSPTDLTLTSVPVTDDPYDPEQTSTREGLWAIRWGERADRSELVLSSSDHKPDTMLELIWRGQVQKKGGR